MDSGSAEVYKRVKGVDGFDIVIDNLRKYDQVANKNIDLKYIIFDLNNDIIEINKFLLFAKSLKNLRAVEFSFDFREVNNSAVSSKTKVAASFFLRFADELGLSSRSFFVGDEMIKEIGSILEK
ncbi:MAG: hypothetical protein IJS50_05760 [Desulfovibrio sp.]|nr:hypothetical protein [Desulfovibrio sp.]